MVSVAWRMLRGAAVASTLRRSAMFDCADARRPKKRKAAASEKLGLVMIAPVQKIKTAGALQQCGAEPVGALNQLSAEAENPICYLFAGALGEGHFAERCRR
jgi:hypothetical protein